MSTRVLVVDDEELIRTGITLVLSSSPLIDVVGQATNGAEAVELAQTLRPDVILMDIRMPVMDGITAARQIRSGATHTDSPDGPAVLVLTAFDTENYVIEAIAAGATGFLLKASPPARLIAAVTSADEGNAPLDAGVLRRLVRTTPPDQPAQQQTTQSTVHSISEKKLATLSERELEIARLIAEGLSNAEIQKRLFISLATTKTHVTHIFEKLGVDNRVRVAVVVLQADVEG